MVRPPCGRIGPITEAERKAIIAQSPVKGKYDEVLDRESAFEKLEQRVGNEAAPADAAGTPQEQEGGGITGWLGGIFGMNRKRGERLTTSQQVARSVARTVTTTVIGGVAASIGKQIGGRTGSSVGRAIIRGTLGGILRR